MRKYITALCMMGILAFGTLGAAVSGHSAKPEYTKLVAAVPFTGISREDVEMVQEKINKITEKELGITVEFPEFSTSGQYFEKAMLMLSTPEQLDIMMAGFGAFMDCYVDGKLLPLDRLLEQYGQDIARQVGEEQIHSCDIHGVLYGIPVNGDYTQQRNCYVMRKDILEKYGLDPYGIRTMEELEHVFETVREKEPEITVLSSGAEPGNTLLSANLDFLDTSSGISLTVCEEDGRLVSAFESEEYKSALQRVHRWYLKGYLNEDVFGVAEDVYSRVKRGELFAYTERKAAWSGEHENFKIGDMEMVRVSPEPSSLMHRGYASMPYVITSNSASPEASMKLLNLFYSNPEIENLLCYGVEGVHYKKTKDGHITHAQKEREDPFLWNSYNMPNQYISHVWEGNDLDFWEQVKTKNESAGKGPKMGFNFDYSSVAAEYARVMDIYHDYRWILESGLDNPEEGGKKMMDEMKSSGLDLIIQEEQKQFDNWRKRNRKGE